MKTIFYSIVLTLFCLTAFSQSPAKYVNLLPAYPPAIGETQYCNFVYSNSGLYMYDIILDSLPHYEIEHIPDQTVHIFEDGIGFYVKADSLHASNVVFNYEVDQEPIGPFEFNANTGRFKFYPDAGDYMPFTITFTANSEENSLSQSVYFDIIPETVPEDLALQSIGEMPSAQDYTIIAESHTQMYLNNENRTAYSYSISGKDIIFDNHVQNQVWGLSGREDLYELNLFAERLYIRSALEFPQTNLTIYAREIIFEDSEEEIALINTTPSKYAILTNSIGLNGANAGNITLHVKKLQADYAKRFILDGGQGQCANSNGTPGKGGDGGILRAPINIESYCDFSRGSAGVQYDSTGCVIGAAHIGENGHFELVSNKYSWIHPYFFAAVIRHINDSYLNNYFSYSKATANDYYNLINKFKDSDEWDNFDPALKIELKDQLTELEGMLYKLNENLDYFGNPLGWAPMLSFEVLLNNYNNEIDRTMPTLYLNYWLQHIDKTLENWVTASQFAADETKNDIMATQSQINSLTNDIPVLEDKISILQNQIEITQNSLEQLKDRLMRKARHNVRKRNQINKLFGIGKAIINCIPVVGPIIHTAATVVGNYFGISDTYGYETAITNAFQNISSFDYKTALGTIEHAIDNIDIEHLGQTGQELSNSYDQLESTIKPVYNSITNLQHVLAQSSAPNDQVQAEFDKLCSQSIDFQNFKEEIAILQQNYEEFAAILTQTIVDIINLTSEVNNEIVTLDALRNDVFQGNSIRDLQAMQCIEKLRQRAMNRLVKYHYYMRKAYEYRLLRSYEGDFSLENMYNRLEAIIDQGQVIFDNSTPVNPTAYSTLATLFREEVSGVIEEIIDELTYNAPEQTATVSIVISKEVLDKINANEEYKLNPFELNVFSPDEENIRIIDFDVQYMEAHTEGNVGVSTYMDMDLKHNGISRFRKNGEIYWFNHISKSTQNPHPNTWRIRYNPLSQETMTLEPSIATGSLLSSLLSGNVENIMMFSRPSAWSDIFMSKKVHSSGNANIIIDSLILNLHYDFTPRPNEIRNIDIATSDDLLPYITCTEVDRNGRSNGKGSFHRSYTRNSGTITFTTMETHGNYHFLNWTDRMGNIVSESTSLTINKMTDQYYRANYELHIPVISVADTIFVGSEGGEHVVQIRNVGLGDIEMDWYVTDSLSTWIHLNGIVEGIDDGYFSFLYEFNENDELRIDSLEILAPEIEGMSKTVYIVQYDHSHFEVNASVDSEGTGTIVGSGFYEEGNLCNLTATPNEVYTFSHWTENGEIVSTEATYSFTVTDNRNLVAHFIHEYHWNVNIHDYPSNMTIIGIIRINGVEQLTKALEIGAFCGNECRGHDQLTDQYFTTFGHYFVFLTVYGNDSNTINFRLYDHTTNKELDLACTPLTFVSNATYGNVSNPYVFNFDSNNITQTSSLNQGWNWWSSFIESDDLLEQLETSLGTNGITIKSQTQFTQRTDRAWIGNLSSINNESTYLIQTNGSSEVSLIGTEASPEAHPITLNYGYNWIGFPNSASMPITTAFSNITPIDGDIVKSQSSFSQYYNNSWIGKLQIINPGDGLLYLSNNNQPVTLIYPENNRDIEIETKNINESYHWSNNIHAYPSNMVITAVIELNGSELRSENYEIAAFSNNECRGCARLMFVEPLNRYMAFLVVSGNEDAELSFALYNTVTKVIVSQKFETLHYTTDAAVGSAAEPYIIRLRDLSNFYESNNYIQLFPNPVAKGENISIILPTECHENIRVEILNNIGVVEETVFSPSLQTITAPTVAGIYTLRLIIDNKHTYYRTLIVE